MNNLEKKVDALIIMALSEDEAERTEARGALLAMMSETKSRAPAKEKPNVKQVMLDLGVPDSLIGHPYLERAIEMAVENIDNIRAITKEMYPNIAKEFHSTPSRVERAIRHCIEVAWERADIDILAKYFGNTVSPSKGKPTNREFIARIANVLRS